MITIPDFLLSDMFYKMFGIIYDFKVKLSSTSLYM